MKHEGIGRWVLAALLAAPVFAQGQEAQAQAATGSVVDQITHSREEGGTLLLDGALDKLPIGAGYDDLTPEQTNLLRSGAWAATGQDRPAFPRHGFLPLVQALLPAQQTLKVDGELRLTVDVDAQGRAQSVSVLQSPDQQLMQIAARSLVQQSYTPAVCGGKACAGKVPVDVMLIRFESATGGACSPPPKYPWAAARSMASGLVSTLLHVSPAGHVVEAVVTHSAGASREHKLLDRTAVDYLTQQNYGHVMRQGVAVGSWRVIELNWITQ